MTADNQIMARQFLVLASAVTLLLSACSEQGTTVVAAGNDATEVPMQATTVSAVPGGRSAEEEPAALDPPIAESVPTQAQPTQTQPTQTQATQTQPTTESESEDLPSWQSQPLALVLLTADDLPVLGLGDGWEERHTDFIELDGPGEVDVVCGAPTPVQTSYFVASFENRDLGVELLLNVMPADETSVATAFIDSLERMATCPNLEDDYSGVSLEVLPLTATGASRSIVITGIDGTSPSEPIGLTLAAAEVDSHLFMVFVAQDDGQPHEADADLALRAIELALSRL